MPRAPSRLLAAALVGGLLTFATAAAQTGGGYDLGWWSVEGGAGVSLGGDFSLTGVAGQADASVVMTGGGFALTGGFMSGGDSRQRAVLIYLPSACRADPCGASSDELEASDLSTSNLATSGQAEPEQ